MNNKNDHKTSLRESIYLLVIVVLAITLCFTFLKLLNQDQLTQESINYATISITPTQSLMAQSDTESAIKSATDTPSPFNIIPIATIGVTQIPVDVPSQLSFSDKYLYVDVNATFTLGVDNPAIGYINLDDPQDNGMNNSDIEIRLEKDKINSFILKPVNGAKDYIPDEA
jgi:hypothetical protein